MATLVFRLYDSLYTISGEETELGEVGGGVYLGKLHYAYLQVAAINIYTMLRFLTRKDSNAYPPRSTHARAHTHTHTHTQHQEEEMGQSHSIWSRAGPAGSISHNI